MKTDEVLLAAERFSECHPDACYPVELQAKVLLDLTAESKLNMWITLNVYVILLYNSWFTWSIIYLASDSVSLFICVFSVHVVCYVFVCLLIIILLISTDLSKHISELSQVLSRLESVKPESGYLLLINGVQCLKNDSLTDAKTKLSEGDTQIICVCVCVCLSVNVI